ncbi:MAG: WYL domain-containing protein [Bacteroidia bacterium]|nr:WYL domain-containing protein [Bacteroidia bacterium]
MEKISRRPGCNFKELYEFLFDEGFEISSRTLQRDIEQIRNEFSVEVLYDSVRKGYFIKSEEGTDIEGFLQLLAINDTNVVLMDSVKEGNSLMKFVQFDKVKNFSGTVHFKPLLEAAQKFKKIKITHKGFGADTEKEYLVEPYILKEYDGRWYVWGKIDAKKGPAEETFRTFGLDRILKTEITGKKFERDKKIDPEEIFAYNLGVIYAAGDPKEITLSFSPMMGKYIKALPIHTSQKIITDDSKEFTIQLFLRINHELKKVILSYGPDVKVLGPKVLATEISSLYKKALKNSG